MRNFGLENHLLVWFTDSETALAPIGVLHVYSHKTCFSNQSVWALYLNFFIIGFNQVVFEGIRGNGFTGDIALDDITFIVSAGSCTLKPSDAAIGKWRLIVLY